MSEDVNVDNVDVGSENETEAEAKEKKERKQYNVSPEEFVKVWQTSNSAAEVAEKLKMPKNIVLARSAVYRKSRKDGSPGINLKKMPRANPRKLDVDALRKLADENAPAEAGASA